MNFNSTRRKIQKTFKRIQDSLNNLTFKSNLKQNISLRTLGIKGPQPLYDSGWIESQPITSPIVPPPNDPDKFVYISNIEFLGNAIRKTLGLVFVTYSFTSDLDVPDDFLPFLKTTILAKAPPTAEILSSEEFEYQVWNRLPSYEIKGDNTLIFKDILDIPINEEYKLSLADLENGVSTLELTSKWFSGRIEYTDGGDSVVLPNASIDSILVNYNHFFSAGKENFDIFTSNALSNFSESSATGKGTFEEHRWAGETPVVTVTKNVIKTVPLSGAFSARVDYFGAKFVNGNLDPTNKFFIITSVTVTSWDVEYRDFHRVFYSDDLARVFYTKIFSNGAFRELENTPVESDYESDTLPYSNITYKINKDSLPDPTSDSIIASENENKSWLKIKETSGLPTQRLKIAGSFYYKAPALDAKPQSLIAENENYSPVDGEYILDGEDRDDKIKNAYFSTLLPIQVRLLVTVDAKLLINQTEHYSQ